MKDTKYNLEMTYTGDYWRAVVVIGEGCEAEEFNIECESLAEVNDHVSSIMWAFTFYQYFDAKIPLSDFAAHVNDMFATGVFYNHEMEDDFTEWAVDHIADNIAPTFSGVCEGLGLDKHDPLGQVYTNDGNKPDPKCTTVYMYQNGMCDIGNGAQSIQWDEYASTSDAVNAIRWAMVKVQESSSDLV